MYEKSQDEYMTAHSTQMYEKSHDEYMTAHSTTQSMYKIGHLTDVRETCDFSYIREMSYFVHTLCCTMCCHVLIM
jgi:hypothetical protein